MVLSKEKRKEYYLKNKEKKNEYSRKYFQANKDKITKRVRNKRIQKTNETPLLIDEMITNFIQNKDYGEEYCVIKRNYAYTGRKERQHLI